jgi:hypothetical protein
MSPTDQARLFGGFRWNQYSPAGQLERGGFFLRQFRRNGGWPACLVLWLTAAFFIGCVAFFVIAVGDAVITYLF